jgi:hypothetical protein
MASSTSIARAMVLARTSSRDTGLQPDERHDCRLTLLWK